MNAPEAMNITEQMFKQESLHCMRNALARQTYPGYPVMSERLFGDITGIEMPEKAPVHPWAAEMAADPGIGLVTGKGAYWNYGPNYTADPIVIRRDFEEPHILLIQRADTGNWALPGGFVDNGEDPGLAAEREAEEESGIVISRFKHTRSYIYGGPIADLRTTANAWPETSAYCFELQIENREDQKALVEMMSRTRLQKVIRSVGRMSSIDRLQNMPWKGSDDARKAAWLPVSKLDDALFGSHKLLIKMALDGL